jgi:TonB family protein
LRENLSLTGRSVQKTFELEVGSLQETITVTAGPGYRASRGGGSTAAAPPYRRDQAEYDPCSASPVGGCIKPPTKIRDVKPIFPQHLSDAKVDGVVRLEATIGVDGSVTSVQPADPADPVDPAFTHAASTAVSQWLFTPTQLGGVPIEVKMKVTANFVIR